MTRVTCSEFAGSGRGLPAGLGRLSGLRTRRLNRLPRGNPGRVRYLLVLALLLMVGGAGCQDRPDWRIDLGSSGGFTGGGTGYRVASDGTVQRWTVLLAGEEPTLEPVGKASEASLAELERAVRDLEGIRMDQPSNMTGSLEWGLGTRSGRFRWPVGADLPEALARAVQAAKAVVASTGCPPPPGL